LACSTSSVSSSRLSACRGRLWPVRRFLQRSLYTAAGSLVPRQAARSVAGGPVMLRPGHLARLQGTPSRRLHGFHGNREPGRRGTRPGRSPPNPRPRPAAGAVVAGVDGRHGGFPRPGRPSAPAHRPEPPAPVPAPGRPEHRSRPVRGGGSGPAVPRRSLPLPARPSTGDVEPRTTGRRGAHPPRSAVPLGGAPARASAGPSGGGGDRAGATLYLAGLHGAAALLR
jgi:hypothetical protein